MPFRNRHDAGRQLAHVLERFRPDHPVVLALPRGGVPVAFEVAEALDAPLEVALVRKIGAPDAPELAVGAVVDGDPPEVVRNKDVEEMYDVSSDYIESEVARQMHEIERQRRLYRGDRPPAKLQGRTVIVVDDGIATGATTRAVLRAVRAARPRRVVLAAPVAAWDTAQALKAEADEVVIVETPPFFRAVGLHYDDFSQTSDGEVVRLLTAAKH